MASDVERDVRQLDTLLSALPRSLHERASGEVRHTEIAFADMMCASWRGRRVSWRCSGP